MSWRRDCAKIDLCSNLILNYTYCHLLSRVMWVCLPHVVSTCLLTTIAHHHNGWHTLPCDGVTTHATMVNPIGNPTGCHSGHLLPRSTVLWRRVHLHAAKANNNIVLNDLHTIVIQTILITIPSGWVGPSRWARHAAATLKAGASCALAAWTPVLPSHGWIIFYAGCTFYHRSQIHCYDTVSTWRHPSYEPTTGN